MRKTPLSDDDSDGEIQESLSLLDKNKKKTRRRRPTTRIPCCLRKAATAICTTQPMAAAVAALFLLLLMMMVLVLATGFLLGGWGSSGNHSVGDGTSGETHQSLHYVSPNDQHGDQRIVETNNNSDDSMVHKKAAAEATENNAQKVARLQSQFAAARAHLLAALRREYGDEALEALFFAPVADADAPPATATESDERRRRETRRRSVGRYLFRSGDPSSPVGWDRAKRKLVLKLIRVLRNTETQKIPFVWSTGGPSTAAGHGNFFSESYTAVAVRAARDAFAAAGLDLVGRNCGMSAAASAMELALCGRQIYGSDTDLMVWDFAVTDGPRNTWGQRLFQYRVGRFFPHRPIQLTLHWNGDQRIRNVRHLERMGLPVLVDDDRLYAKVLEAIPDSFGKSDAELEAMPPSVRNFKCNGLIEFGDPYCKSEKFNMTDCPKRLFQMKWHPGWKTFALLGNIMALFLVELLEDALDELASSNEDPAVLWETLQATEDAEHAQFLNAPIDFPGMQDALKGIGENDGFDFAALATAPTFCHTARLPAEIRHRGILTESPETTCFSTDCDRGILLEDALASPDATGTSLRLAHDNTVKDDCPILTHVDYQDFYLVTGSEGFKTLTVPNDAELKEYGTGDNDDTVLKGYVAICFPMCRWNRCDKNELRRDDFLEGKFQLTVNGRPVDSLTDFLPTCELLRSDSTGYLWQPNAEGRFEVGAEIITAGPKATASDFLRLSGIIVW